MLDIILRVRHNKTMKHNCCKDLKVVAKI